MAFTVEDGTGKSDANALIDVAFFKSYHDDRGNDYSTASDSDIEQAIVKATDYIETRWDGRWLGSREFEDQALAFPRINLYNHDGEEVETIPARLKNAVAEYAFISLSQELMPNPAAPPANGRIVKSTRERVGPIEEETTYQGSQIREIQPFPKADRWIKLFTVPGGRLIRA